MNVLFRNTSKKNPELLKILPQICNGIFSIFILPMRAKRVSAFWLCFSRSHGRQIALSVLWALSAKNHPLCARCTCFLSDSQYFFIFMSVLTSAFFFAEMPGRWCQSSIILDPISRWIIVQKWIVTVPSELSFYSRFIVYVYMHAHTRHTIAWAWPER